MGTRACLACDRSGVVPDIDGKDRPCSRCRADDFNAWAEERRRDAAEEEKDHAKEPR